MHTAPTTESTTAGARTARVIHGNISSTMMTSSDRFVRGAICVRTGGDDEVRVDVVAVDVDVGVDGAHEAGIEAVDGGGQSEQRTHHARDEVLDKGRLDGEMGKKPPRLALTQA